jgi:membrane fusion protein (multidrug efflux system)
VPLDLILVDGSVYPKPGKFTLLNRQVDPTTGTFKVGGLFPNPDGHAAPRTVCQDPGHHVDVQKGALLVPQRAVTEVQGKYLVAVVGEGNKVDIRPVKPGERIGSDWIISAGAQARRKDHRRRHAEGPPGTAVVNPQAL